VAEIAERLGAQARVAEIDESVDQLRQSPQHEPPASRATVASATLEATQLAMSLVVDFPLGKVYGSDGGTPHI
jgi:hypothetical protein